LGHVTGINNVAVAKTKVFVCLTENDVNYALIEIGCGSVMKECWRRDNVFLTMELFLRQCVRRVVRNEGRLKAICILMLALHFVFGYIMPYIVYIVPYIESKNRTALDYALNCLERKRFRMENVSFSFFRSRGSYYLVFLPSKRRFMKRIQKIPVANRNRNLDTLSCVFFQFPLWRTYLFIRISLLEVIFIFTLSSMEIYVINAYFVGEISLAHSLLNHSALMQILHNWTQWFLNFWALYIDC